MINRTTLLVAQTIPFIEWLAPALMAAGLFLLLVIAVLLARRPRMASSRHSASDALHARELVDARQELQDERQRIAELIGVAQRLASKSDDKAVLLNQLITQADERLAALGDTLSPDVAETKLRTAAPPVDGGDVPVEIAREVNEPQAEVELVIARKNAAQASEA